MDGTSKQLIREMRIGLPVKRGKMPVGDYEYFRRGVCNVFMASEPLAANRFAKTAELTKKDWENFMGLSYI